MSVLYNQVLSGQHLCCALSTCKGALNMDARVFANTLAKYHVLRGVEVAFSGVSRPAASLLQPASSSLASGTPLCLAPLTPRCNPSQPGGFIPAATPQCTEDYCDCVRLAKSWLPPPPPPPKNPGPLPPYLSLQSCCLVHLLCCILTPCLLLPAKSVVFASSPCKRQGTKAWYNESAALPSQFLCSHADVVCADGNMHMPYWRIIVSCS